MKAMIALLAFVMLSQAQAQSQPQNEVLVQSAPAAAAPAAPRKRTMIYDERTNELAEVQPQRIAAEAPQPTGSPIYILNNQNQRFNGAVDNNANSGASSGARQSSGQSQVQEQPTTIVQDTPLKTGAAEKIRARRQETEAATEDGIVQALEKARMDDELHRRDKFNNAIAGSETPAAAPVAAPVAAPQPQLQPQPVLQVIPIPVQVQAPTPAPKREVVVVEEEEEVRPARVSKSVESEIRAPAPEVKAPDARQTYYVSGLLGLGKYPDVVNVRGNVAAGFAVGTVTPERFVGEASFIYGSYDLEDVYQSWYGNSYAGRQVSMNQYDIGLAAKYNILPGRLRPYVGVVGAYIRRSYSDKYAYNGDSFSTSNAFDVGGTAGVDLQISETFAIGFDFRYMTNVFYRENTNYPASFVYPMQKNVIEKLDYYTAGVVGKYTF